MLRGLLVRGSIWVDVDVRGCTPFRVGIEFREVANLLGRMREMRTSMSVGLHNALAYFAWKRDLLLVCVIEVRCPCYEAKIPPSKCTLPA